MQIPELNADRLRAYPELAQKLVRTHATLIQRLPLPFASLLMREVIGYDWKFPVERAEVESDFKFLTSLPQPEFDRLMKPFSAIRLTPALERSDWVLDPIAYAEKLSAHLWSTRQIDQFRSAAVDYMDRRVAAHPPRPPAVPRLTLVLIGEGASKSEVPLFRKLRPHGTLFQRIAAPDSPAALVRVVADRASAQPEPFAHWYVDGGRPVPAPPGVASISYDGLARARTLLQLELKDAYDRKVGSEQIRSQLAQKKPEQLGFTGKGNQAVLDRFAMSILTEGSGTQIYSTTFLQWTVREVSRRAQPLTLLARFRPRQREKSMQELLLESGRAPDLDPAGSLVDADMGAYYAWLSQQRLPGADQSRFVVLFEGHNEGLVIGPGIARGHTTSEDITLDRLVKTAIA